MIPSQAQTCLALTPRWHPLRYHPEQYRLYHDPKRFKIAKAGRRSGKTENAKRKLVMSNWDHCPANPNRRQAQWHDPRWFAGAPTRDQAKAIFWNDLKRLTPDAWIGRIYEGDLCIRTKWDSELWVTGLDKPQRIEGRSWDGGCIDEFADCKPGMLDANIRPALADRGGWLWLLGVPDMASPGQIEYRDLVQDATTKLKNEWGVYSWPSADILPPEEVESARQKMDPRVFEQEYLGAFVLDGGRAFPDFEYGLHVRDEIATYDPALPIAWCLDFNVDPFCSGVAQVTPQGEVRIIDELIVQSTVTPAMCDAFMDRAAERKWNLTDMSLYGDPAGNQRRTTAAVAGQTDWTIVRNKLRDVEPMFRVRSKHASIADTRNAVNAKLKNAAGDSTLFIHSKCRQLIKDLNSLLWPSDLSEGHCAAWLRYLIEREFPIRREMGIDDPYEVAVL